MTLPSIILANAARRIEYGFTMTVWELVVIVILAAVILWIY